MASDRGLSNLDGLVQEILATELPPIGRRSVEFESAAAKIEALAKHDYRSALRKTLRRVEVRQVISEAKRNVWPRLNEEPVRLVSPQEITRRWSGLGVEFSLARLTSSRGMALLGFYLRQNPSTKRPLICVNTNQHRAMVGATFIHEMGHHLLAEMFDARREPELLLYTGYAGHLDDQAELAADSLVSFGAFPRKVARGFFGRSPKAVHRNHADEPGGNFNLTETLEYFAKRYGFRLDKRLSKGNRLQYLAAMIHYTKLRQALLDEYDL